MTILELRNLSKYYGDVTAVEDVSLSIDAGEFITLLGPSGSGKTTILQMVAGFNAPSSGSVNLNGRDISRVAVNRRNMGFVFQDYALFPHMNVFKNIAYPLHIRRQRREEVAHKVEEIMNLVQLADYRDRKPAELSGGQQQRVALARALVFDPSVILMDEPLGALDKNLRTYVQLELKRIQEVTGITIVFVTHDQEEALVMSDRIAVLNDSRMVQFDSPRELYEAPNSRFVANFLGENNFLPATVDRVERGHVVVETVQGRYFSPPAPRLGQVRAGSTVSLAVRPESLNVSPGAAGSDELVGTVVNRIYQGDSLKYQVAIADAEGLLMTVRTTSGAEIEGGERVAIGLKEGAALNLLLE